MQHFTVEITRSNSKRYRDEILIKQANEFTLKVLSRSKNWKIMVPKPLVKEKNGCYVTLFRLKFERSGGHDSTSARQFLIAMQTIQDFAKSSKWGEKPWNVKLIEKIGLPDIKLSDPQNAPSGGGEEDDVNFDRALTLQEIEKILDNNKILVNGTDQQIENHPNFQGIYDRGSQIRVCFSSIRRFINTKGQRRHHCLLYGPPGTAKSHIFGGIRKVLGLGGYYDLNSDSSTKAGVQEKMLRLHDQGVGIPPVMFIEEIEKAPGEHVTAPWLSILDDRRELRKLTAHKSRRIEINILCFATCNDKKLFDQLHGGRPGFPGALSSRFCKQLYVPRPSWDVMRRILIREIKEYGGNIAWVEPCIKLAQHIACDDPRKVISFLDGEDRLLDGSYQEDIIRIEEDDSTDLLDVA